MRCTLKVEWLNFLEGSLKTILGSPELAYKNMEWKDIPETAGVCLITVGDEPYYVGSTKKLQNRIKQLLTGNAKASSFKKGLVDSGECVNIEMAEQFLRQNAVVRRIEEKDMRTRVALKAYFTGVLFPKYGITEEH
jgi:predicted GIY-YIG superfamily endonuclease